MNEPAAMLANRLPRWLRVRGHRRRLVARVAGSVAAVAVVVTLIVAPAPAAQAAGGLNLQVNSFERGSNGEKTPFNVLGRDRIADGMTRTTVSEAKNVGHQAYTQQLKDHVTFSTDTNRQFFLYVRGGANPTTLSTPPQEAVGLGQVTLRYIP